MNHHQRTTFLDGSNIQKTRMNIKRLLIDLNINYKQENKLNLKKLLKKKIYAVGRVD